MAEEKQESAEGVGKAGQRWAPLKVRWFTPVPEFFLDQCAALDISPGQAMFIIHLMSYKRADNIICPKMKTLADRMGMSYSQIRKYCASLERNGYLRRTLRKGKPCLFDLEPLCTELERLRKEREAEELARVRRRGGHFRG